MRSDDTTAIQQQHEAFIQKICASEVVWCLENKDGVALSNSWEYTNGQGEPLGLICFWSEEAKAKACAKDEWFDYHTISIPLDDFIEIFCLGMANDGFFLGTDFDSNMYGHEIDPLDLILEIHESLKKMVKKIKLKNYPNMQILVNDIEDLMNG